MPLRRTDQKMRRVEVRLGHRESCLRRGILPRACRRDAMLCRSFCRGRLLGLGFSGGNM